ncbi:Mobile element protein (plasmid) [Escherichia coli]|nr:Mobile element protein [Escherichia coli]SMZ42936.1 Mobile element protein [Escherichia coli]
MAKQKFRITNWSTYNKALINRGSLTFWLDDEAIQAWYESAAPALFCSRHHHRSGD